MTVVDAHHHLWTADYEWLAGDGMAPIHRDYTVEDLRPHLSGARIDHTVLVEAARCDAAETTAFLALAAATPEIVGVVGWASLSDPDLARTVEGHRAGPGGELLVGIRDQAQGQPDDFLDRVEVRDGLAVVASLGLVNELVVRAAQLPSVARAATALPDARFVLDHLGKPPIAAGGWAEWSSMLASVAACPNVVAKVSGLVAEADWAMWTVDDLRPYVETAIELFGPSRLMFGSDWPVCELAATYEEVVAAVEEIVGGRPADLFGGTAVRTYHLEIR